MCSGNSSSQLRLIFSCCLNLSVRISLKSQLDISIRMFDKVDLLEKILLA